MKLLCVCVVVIFHDCFKPHQTLQIKDQAIVAACVMQKVFTQKMEIMLELASYATAALQYQDCTQKDTVNPITQKKIINKIFCHFAWPYMVTFQYLLSQGKGYVLFWNQNWYYEKCKVIFFCYFLLPFSEKAILLVFYPLFGNVTILKNVFFRTFSSAINTDVCV